MGIDAYLTWIRIELLGHDADLNPVVRWLAQKFGPQVGAAGLIASNTLLLSMIVFFRADTLLHIVFGGKLALIALQYRGYSALKELRNVSRKTQ